MNTLILEGVKQIKEKLYTSNDELIKTLINDKTLEKLIEMLKSSSKNDTEFVVETTWLFINVCASEDDFILDSIVSDDFIKLWTNNIFNVNTKAN